MWRNACCISGHPNRSRATSRPSKLRPGLIVGHAQHTHTLTSHKTVSSQHMHQNRMASSCAVAFWNVDSSHEPLTAPKLCFPAQMMLLHASRHALFSLPDFSLLRQPMDSIIGFQSETWNSDNWPSSCIRDSIGTTQCCIKSM